MKRSRTILVVTVIALGLAPSPRRACAATGAGAARPAAAKAARRAGVRELVRDAAALATADVVEIRTGQTKGTLTSDELKALADELRRGHPRDGALVVTTPPWDAVLVLNTKTHRRYVAQLVGDQWLRVEDPDPLARQASGQPPSAARAGEVLLDQPTVVWKALERILGRTKNKEYLGHDESLRRPEQR